MEHRQEWRDAGNQWSDEQQNLSLCHQWQWRSSGDKEKATMKVCLMCYDTCRVNIFTHKQNKKKQIKIYFGIAAAWWSSLACPTLRLILNETHAQKNVLLAGDKESPMIGDWWRPTAEPGIMKNKWCRSSSEKMVDIDGPWNMKLYPNT